MKVKSKTIPQPKIEYGQMVFGGKVTQLRYVEGSLRDNGEWHYVVLIEKTIEVPEDVLLAQISKEKLVGTK